jgi:hypothetical protein
MLESPNRWLRETGWTTFGRILIVLGEMGPQAQIAVPLIIQMLSHSTDPPPLPNLFQLAHDALRKIDPDSAAKLDSHSK